MFSGNTIARALPVIDSNDVLVGIVTSDDMLDVAEEEATEDIQKFGGMEAWTSLTCASRSSHGAETRRLAGGFVPRGNADRYGDGDYEDEIAKAVVLALFLPMIISSGGNSGSQASTLMIRAMALGEITLKDWWRVMRTRDFRRAIAGSGSRERSASFAWRWS